MFPSVNQFNVKFVIACAVGFFGWLFLFSPIEVEAATVNVSGNISTNTTWTNFNLYIVNGPLTIDPGVTLTINPGTIVKFSDYTSRFEVKGTLDADGTSSDKIYFTSYKDDSIGGDTNGDGSATSPSPGDWGTIVVNGGGYASIEHSILEYGGGWTYSTILVEGSYGGGILTMSNSEVTQSYKYGIHQANGTNGFSSIQGSVIHDNLEHGVYMQTGDMELTGNGIYDNYGYGVYNGTSTLIDAEGNWWGHSSGPYHVLLYPSGQGDEVTQNVDANNWLTTW